MARVVAEHPSRLVGTAALPMQCPELAAKASALILTSQGLGPGPHLSPTPAIITAGYLVSTLTLA